jgi:CheY-like chemotaxis protein
MNEKKTACFLIDDDVDDQEIFILALSQMDIPVSCYTADDGYLALQHFQQDPNFIPDLIFLDLNMPRVNGMQCLVEIKKDPRLSHIPVIIYSTSSSLADRQTAELLGASDFITKLTDIDELFKTLQDMFRKHLKSSDISI